MYILTYRERFASIISERISVYCDHTFRDYLNGNILYDNMFTYRVYGIVL